MSKTKLEKKIYRMNNIKNRLKMEAVNFTMEITLKEMFLESMLNKES